MTVTFTETDDGLDAFLIGRRSNNKEGRAQLVAEGKYTQEQADSAAKKQHRSGAKTRSGPFIAWDGEGVTEDDRHKYIMLCNSEGEILRAPKKGGTIRTQDALDMLCNTAKRHPNANHVIYGGSYDANMILADLSLYDCQTLAQTGQVYWSNFRIAYRPRKFFMVTRYEGKEKEVTITLWDVIGFFQMSFIRALDAWKIGTETDTEFVENMKYGRSSFSRAEQKEIERYCFVECNQLVEVMTKLRNHTRALDLTPTRYDGAGALSTKLLQKYKVKKCMSRDIPPRVNLAARYAYFGGRIEVLQYGNYEHTVYAHDVVSAYPSAMTHLPCLAHGKWIHGKKMNPKHFFQMCRVKWHMGLETKVFPNIDPLPSRSPQDNITFASEGRGWYWKPEIDNLIKHVNPDEYQILESWSFIPGCDHQPFSYIPEVFEHRKRLKKDKNLAQIILKLALNGTYGKLAQQVGSKDGEPPTYHQLEWAGYITSYTRALVYDLAMTNPDSVIAFETDGLYATVPLTTHDDTESLGSWEVKEYNGITYVTSGVYWVNQGTPIRAQDWSPKYRGFDPPKKNPQTGEYVQGLERDFILEAWAENISKIEATSTRFKGLYVSCLSPQSFVDWRQWITTQRQLVVRPRNKRNTLDYEMARSHDKRWAKTLNYHPLEGLVRTYSAWYPYGSQPHKLAWVDDGHFSLTDPRYLEMMEQAEDEDSF